MGFGIKIDSYKLDLWVFGICLILAIPPYFLWQLSSPYFGLGCLLIAAKYLKRARFAPYDVVFMVLMAMIYIFFAFIGISSVRGSVYVCLMVVLFFTDRGFLKDAFEKFVWVFSVTLIPSLMQFILVVLLGIDMPHYTMPPLNSLKDVSYVVYGFFVMPDSALDLDFIPRFCGYYDEPGVVGTFAAIILLVQRFNLKKMINIPLFIAGLLSFSLFFYAITIGYLLLSTVFRRLKYTILLIALGVALYGIFSEFLEKNETINQYVISRMEYGAGDFVGNNRAQGNFKIWYENEFVDSDDYLLGMGRGANQLYNLGGASYRDLIVNYGIIFFCIYMGIFTTWAFYKLRWSKEFFIYMVILYGTIFQRPFIDGLVYLFLLFVPVIYLATNRNHEKYWVSSSYQQHMIDGLVKIK